MRAGVAADHMPPLMEVAQRRDAQKARGADLAGGDEEMASPAAFFENAGDHVAAADASVVEGKKEKVLLSRRGENVRAGNQPCGS